MECPAPRVMEEEGVAPEVEEQVVRGFYGQAPLSLLSCNSRWSVGL